MSKADLSVFDEMYQATVVDLGMEDDISRSKFFYEIFDGDLDEVGYVSGEERSWEEDRDAQEKLLSQFDYKLIESEGGHEGGGEYCYGIIKFQGKFYKAEWQYYSYNGCEYDYIEETIKEVTPVEKTITVYE